MQGIPILFYEEGNLSTYSGERHVRSHFASDGSEGEGLHSHTRAWPLGSSECALVGGLLLAFSTSGSAICAVSLSSFAIDLESLWLSRCCWTQMPIMTMLARWWELESSNTWKVIGSSSSLPEVHIGQITHAPQWQQGRCPLLSLKHRSVLQITQQGIKIRKVCISPFWSLISCLCLQLWYIVCTLKTNELRCQTTWAGKYKQSPYPSPYFAALLY